jgi:hypothetical protein
VLVNSYNKVRLFKNSFRKQFFKTKLLFKKHLINSFYFLRSNNHLFKIINDKKNVDKYNKKLKIENKKFRLSLFLLKLKYNYVKIIKSYRCVKYYSNSINNKLYYKKKNYTIGHVNYNNSISLRKKHWKLWKKFKNYEYRNKAKNFKNSYRIYLNRRYFGYTRKLNSIFLNKISIYSKNKLFSKFKFTNLITMLRLNNNMKSNVLKHKSSRLYFLLNSNKYTYLLNKLYLNYLVCKLNDKSCTYNNIQYTNNYYLNNGNRNFKLSSFSKFKLKKSKLFIFNKYYNLLKNKNIFFNKKYINKIKFLNKLSYSFIGNSVLGIKNNLAVNNNIVKFNSVLKKKLFNKYNNNILNKLNEFKFFRKKKLYITGHRLSKVNKFIKVFNTKRKFKRKIYKTKNIKSILWSLRFRKRKKFYLWNRKFLFLWNRIKSVKYKHKNLGSYNTSGILKYKKIFNISKKKIKILKFINKILYLNLKLHRFYSKSIYKSFKWKFILRKWFYTYSKWKRLSVFNVLIKQAWDDYRKLKKNFFFIKLFKANFNYLIGINEYDLLNKWIKIRKSNVDNLDTVGRFNQMLQLKLDGLILFLGFSSTRFMAQELVRCGCIRINGVVNTNINTSFNLNDIIQFDLGIKKNLKKLYKLNHWLSIKSRLQYTNFLYTSWPLLMFTLVRRPNTHELLEESIFNERWVRFFIRYFPIKISHYKKPKIKWYKY